MAGVSKPNEATRRRRDEIVALYRELGPELTRWARLLVGDAQAARCVREAFVRLYSGADILLIDDPVHEARIALFSVARSYRTSTRKKDRRQPDPKRAAGHRGAAAADRAPT
jgi:DNA-directed RNA polymerase specialized sigma24 family protein